MQNKDIEVINFRNILKSQSIKYSNFKIWIFK